MTTSERVSLLGRDAERAFLWELLCSAREGRSRSVVVRGEAGIGKTSLLDELAASATDFRVVRASGVEFESDLPFAGLTALTRPILGALGRLPPIQATLFRSATAMGDAGRPADRMTVYAATLSLLATSAEDKPLLCLVDDAHWLDRASAEALLFCARRLLAEEILLVFAARHVPQFTAPGIAELVIDGLDEETGIALLRRGGVVSRLVAKQLVATTHGNPLALSELALAMSDDQKTGQEPLGDPLPTTDRLERVFTDRVAALAPDEQRALLLCAAAGAGTAELIGRALAVLGLDVFATDAAARLGLLRVSRDSVTFRHPVIRSAVYTRAGFGERRQVHAALADACVAPEDADRRAWHLSAATLGTDAAVATALAETAERARNRGGLAAEALALERAATLTPEPRERGLRLASAAQAWTSAGAVEHATRLLEQAAPFMSGSPGDRCSLLAQQGYLAMLRGEATALFDEMVTEAERAAETDRFAAGIAISMAVNAPMSRWDVAAVLRICTRAMELATPDGPKVRSPKIAVRLANAMILAGVPDGAALAARCVPVCAQREAYGACGELGEVLTWIEEYDLARRMLDHDVEGARALGDVSLLAYALPLRARLELRVGRLAAAHADALEGVELADTMGQPGNLSDALCVLAQVRAAMGRETGCGSYPEEAMALVPHHLTVEAQARAALGVAALAAGRYDEAVTELGRVHAIMRAGGVREPGVVPVAADLAEALIREGRPAEAERVLRELEADATATGRRGQLAAAARTWALLAGDDEAETLFLQALNLFATLVAPLDHARTHLYYGRWLRRTKRRQHARAQLTIARDMFETAGATIWAEHAIRELAPSATRRPNAAFGGEADLLTPHEWRIAYAAAHGRTSREIASQIFLSVRTVDYHLGNVYRKLGVRSRRDLVSRFGPDLALSAGGGGQ